MKLTQIKATVYRLTEVTTTAQLKQLHPELCKGRNLRTKAAWTDILEALEPADEDRNHLEDCLALEPATTHPEERDRQHLERCWEASPKGAKGRIRFHLDRLKRNLDAEIVSLEKCREELKRYKKKQ